MTVQENLAKVKGVLAEANKYRYASTVLHFEKETICPIEGMQEMGEVSAFLGNLAYQLIKDPAFAAAVEELYAAKEELGEFERAMVAMLHRGYLKSKNISAEEQYAFSLVYNEAFVNWSKARAASDFSLFAPSLQKVYDTGVKEVALREADPEESGIKLPYDHLLNDYERGMNTEILDEFFAECKERLVPFLQKIVQSKKEIRTDFLHRPVKDGQQAEMAKYLLEVLDYDFNRGAFTTSEHPFTTGVGPNDVRVTTHYYPTEFASSMYSIIHECGHALFDLLQPRENYDFFIDNEKTLGMNESVSRFYENRIGRSREFISLIYPKAREIFADILGDVSEEEFYEAMNIVRPSLIRTEADEFTYTFHVIIRYEIEKALFAGELTVDDLPRVWTEKYQNYLGIAPDSDRTGILQDMHWTFGFGYFPTYAIGNFYNAMYIKRLQAEMDLPAAVAQGDFKTINRWMAQNVFAKADRLAPREWIKDITGRALTAKDFLDYLEEKYGAMYQIS